MPLLARQFNECPSDDGHANSRAENVDAEYFQSVAGPHFEFPHYQSAAPLLRKRGRTLWRKDLGVRALMTVTILIRDINKKYN